MAMPDSIPARVVRLYVGLFLFALGTVCTLRAELGISPWDVLADGIRINTPLTFGQAVIAIGAILIAVSFIFGIKPGFGTVSNMIFIGLFADLMLNTGVGEGLPEQNVVVRVVVLLAGIAIIGLGSALYIGAEMGAGPRDSLMVTVSSRTSLSVRLARTVIEGSALLAGIALGGSFGIGTAVFALTIGPSVHFFFDRFGMDSAGRRPGPLPEGSEGH